MALPSYSPSPSSKEWISLRRQNTTIEPLPIAALAPGLNLIFSSDNLTSISNGTVNLNYSMQTNSKKFDNEQLDELKLTRGKTYFPIRSRKDSMRDGRVASDSALESESSSQS